MKKLLSAIAVAFSVLWGVLWLDLPKAAQDQASSAGPEVIPEVAHAVSEPVRDLPPSAHAAGPPHTIPLLKPFGEHGGGGQVVDPELQTLVGPLVSTTTPLSFLGVGVGLGNYSDCCAPPDTNGAAGATQFVQWVNLDFAVFSKTGTLVHGPVAGNSLWSNLGGQCAAHNDGDPIAHYDKAAGRWVLAQPVFRKPYTYCLAVSQTSDATGSYNLYAFSMPNFPDYPKLGVWPDGYYASFNMFKGNRFVGARACAFNRAAMLSGATATMV